MRRPQGDGYNLRLVWPSDLRVSRTGRPPNGSHEEHAQRDSDRNAYRNSNRNSDTDSNAYNNLDPDDHANSDFNTCGHTEAYSDPKG